MARLTLTKHHGLGNDFLVLVDADPSLDLPALARALCDRRRGMGADGLIAAHRPGARSPGTPADADERRLLARMVLHNADGSRAEMSGNGIRCLAQALVDAGLAPEGCFTIATDAGDREVTVGADDGTGLRLVSVAIGPAKVLRLGDGEADVDTGNPHVVRLVDDPAAVDLEAAGADRPDVNLEVVRVDGPGEVTLRVHERGAGITEACGTGSCATVAATVAWGLTGPEVTVHNPGGDLAVALDGDEATLTGPTQRIAVVEIDTAAFRAGAGPQRPPSPTAPGVRTGSAAGGS